MGLSNGARRMALREKLSIREIARRTGLSRNTVTEHLNAGTIQPKFVVPKRPSKLDAFADKLAGWLKTKTGNSRKQHRNLKQPHSDLVALGFTGSYGRVAALARKWRPNPQREQQTKRDGTLAWRVRATDLPRRRGVPVRLERGLRSAGRRADQAAGRTCQARAQPSLSGACRSPANP